MNWKEQRTDEWDTFDAPSKGYFIIMGFFLLILGMTGVSVMCSYMAFVTRWKLIIAINEAINIFKIIQAIVAWFN